MLTISNHRRLRDKIEAVLPAANAVSTAIVTHECFREVYPDFLITMHQMIRATVPLMRTARQRCIELSNTDPVAAAMVPYFEQHIREEMHHDDWVLEDLKLLGVTREDVLARMPSPAIASLVGAQYYWIHHHHPVTKLGQIAVMEGYPATLEAIDLMQYQSGLPRQAFRTIEKHSHIDQKHRDDFDQMIDSLELSERQHEIIGVSALHTVDAAIRSYEAILELADSKLQQRRAS